MKKIITIITLYFTICFSQDAIPSALLDFSNYTDEKQIDRPIERFYGLNPYNLGGLLYTKSSNYSSDKLLQRDIDFHWGTNMITWSLGINVKQYWFNSKYKAVSYFSSTSSSLGIVLGMGSEGGMGLDIHSIASGIDFNLIRFNSFDIRFTLGLQAIGSFTIMKGSAIPVINFSLRTGK
tara:strand:- start:3033 stop:3569 length:537 start_codon:yes stop_codon:yes gene_type:complete